MGENCSAQLFILGCERSGSTWLSNIIDSHPSVEFFMEPFAVNINVFPGFPERNLYIENCNKGLMELLKSEYEKLPEMKYLFYKRKSNPYLRILDSLIILVYSNIIRILRCRPSERVRRVIELNLNRKNTMVQVTLKNKEITLYATKDLRLNFKLGLLNKIFPNAKYLITIRNPGAQLSSILRLMDKGNLGELKQSLLSLPEYFRTNNRFEKYLSLIDQQHWGKDIQEMLIIWWLVNYDILIGDCRKFNVDYKIIYHEDISENLYKVSKEIFDFISLTYSEEVLSYLAESSTKEKEIKNPLDTVRNTSKYYKEQINQVDPLLMARIKRILNFIQLEDDLERYKI